MNINVSVNDLERDIKTEVLYQVKKRVTEEMNKIDIKSIIEQQVKTSVAVSPKVNDKQIKDFVRERIAKIVTIDIIKEDDNSN